MNANTVRVICRPSTRFSPSGSSTWSTQLYWQGHHHRHHPSIPVRYMSPQVRHMGFFQEFYKRLKGELEKNPELQKSIQELKENSGNLKSRTKETTERMFKHVEMLRQEAQAKAMQVSSVVVEKVEEAKSKVLGITSVKEKEEKVSEATPEVKDTMHHKDESEHEYAKREQDSTTSNADASRSGSDGNHSNVDGNKSSAFANAFKSLSSSTSQLFNRIKATKMVDLLKQGYDLAREELKTTSSKRLREKAKAKAAKYYETSTAPRSSCTDVVPVVKKQSAWEKRWDFFKSKAEANRVYKRFKGVKKHPLIVKGQEIAEDMRERWETSDNPMIHKIQDLNESLFGETATAMALKEIRKRDYTFTFPDFLAEVQENARDVLHAYLKGDIEELQKRCTREVIDRCRAERRAYESQGIFFDNKILHISDIELRDTKLMGNVPIIIVTFQTQQVFCVRDKHGKITQGAKDDILTVHYAWAMQQVGPEEMDEDEIFPQWQLREMQQLGVRAII